MDDISDTERERRRQYHAEVRAQNEARYEQPSEIAKGVDNDDTLPEIDPFAGPRLLPERMRPSRREPPRQGRGLDTAPPAPFDYWSEIDRRIVQRVEAERALVVQIAGEALGEALAEMRKDYKREVEEAVRAIRIEVTKMESAVVEVLKTERTKSVDL